MWLSGRRLAVLLVLLAGIGVGATLVIRLMDSFGPRGSAVPRSHDGRALFAAHCTVCHGVRGKGDGPGAEVIRQKIVDFTDPAAMRGVSDRFLFEIIQKGGSQFGRSNAMPAWGMKLTDDDIRAVVAYIRSLASQGPPATPGRKDTP